MAARHALVQGWGRSPTACLTCDRPFPGPATALGLPSRGWVAYDPQQGHLWLICERCHAWSLMDLRERGDLVDRLEWQVRAQGTTIGGSRNVRLVRLGDRTVVRIGSADLPDRAFWRYGQALRKRRRWFVSPLTQAGAAVYGALGFVGESVGLVERTQKIRWDPGGIADLVRWRRFGWAAWRGRRACPNCGSVLRALPYTSSWGLRPVLTDEGFGLSVPCPRCDFWTPEKVYRLSGSEAEWVLRRVLAYQHVDGADEGIIRRAADQIEREGSVADFCLAVAARGTSLWSMDPDRRVGLEIAVNHLVEQRTLQGHARTLVARWRREHELARIQDTELG